MIEINWELYNGTTNGRNKKICQDGFIEFYKTVANNGHKLLSCYVNKKTKVLIDFNCKHDPKYITPEKYLIGRRCTICGKLATKEHNKNTSKMVGLEFCELVESNGHKILSEYVNSKTHVLIDYNCGHKPNMVMPSNYKKGVSCPHCRNKILQLKNTQKSKKEFKEMVERDGFILKSEYINNRTDVIIDFGCGHGDVPITPSSYKRGSRCRYCFGRNTESGKEQLLKKIQEYGHKLKSEYINNSTPILVDFGCEHGIQSVYPDTYKSSGRCKKCLGICPEQAKNDLINLVAKNGHTLKSEYVNTHTPVIIDFGCEHGDVYIAPSSYKAGCGCRKCTGLDSGLAKEDFLSQLSKNGHKLLTEYKNTDTKVLIDYNCGHKPSFITPDKYKCGQRCSLCSGSNGERIVVEYLNSIGIDYITQYKIGDVNKFYDIYIPSLNLIVEVHGMQHYEESNRFLGSRSLKEEQENDNYKQKYAESLGYNYMIIDYREHKPKLALTRFKNQFREYINNI